MKKKMGAVLLVIIISLALGLPAPQAALAAGNIIYVDADASGLNDGSSWEDAYTDLQSALADTDLGAGDQIWVAAGTYTPGTARTDSFDLVDGVTLYGGFAGGETSLEQRDWENNETILSGEINDLTKVTDNSYHVVTSSGLDEYAVLDGFIITGGNANGLGENERGGGMYNHSSSSPTVTNCNFENNSANFGGGMLNITSSSPTVTNCTFENNSANYGSGMYNYISSSPTVTNCNFSGNSAKEGGGMLNITSSSPTVTDSTFSGNKATSTIYGGGGMSNNDSSSPTVTSCTFENNSASNAGGGMYNYNSSPTLTSCTFSNNSADYFGGGMGNYDYSSPTVTSCNFSNNSADYFGGGMGNDYYSSPTLTNCTFYENSAAWWGGGMYNNYSSPTVTNCTFYENSADDGHFNYYGGGMLNNQFSSKPTVTNCILWNNSPDQIGNRNGSANVTYSDVQGGYPGDGNMGDMPGDDPKFADAASGDFHLLSDSPCIDKGTNFAPALPDTDFDGDDRKIDGDNNGTATVDMGADEFVPEAELITAMIDIKPDTLNLSSKGKWITCYIELPDDYDVAGINVSTLLLNETVPAESEPTEIGDYDEDGITDLIVKFDRASVQVTLEVGDEVEIVITGKLTDADGTSFEGTDTIKVTDKSND